MLEPSARLLPSNNPGLRVSVAASGPLLLLSSSPHCESKHCWHAAPLESRLLNLLPLELLFLLLLLVLLMCCASAAKPDFALDRPRTLSPKFFSVL